MARIRLCDVERDTIAIGLIAVHAQATLAASPVGSGSALMPTSWPHSMSISGTRASASSPKWQNSSLQRTLGA